MLEGTIVSSRLLQFGCTLVLLGLPLFCLYGVSTERQHYAPKSWPWARHGVLIGAIGGLSGAALWTATQAALFFPNNSFFHPGSITIILTETGFGRVTLFRASVLVATIAVILAFIPSRLILTILSILGGLAVGSFAWVGHGSYDSGLFGVIHQGADVLNLLTAGLWIGGAGGFDWRFHAITK